MGSVPTWTIRKRFIVPSAIRIVQNSHLESKLCLICGREGIQRLKRLSWVSQWIQFEDFYWRESKISDGRIAFKNSRDSTHPQFSSRTWFSTSFVRSILISCFHSLIPNSVIVYSYHLAILSPALSHSEKSIKQKSNIFSAQAFIFFLSKNQIIALIFNL